MAPFNSQFTWPFARGCMGLHNNDGNGREITVKKIGDGLKEVKTNLRFFGLNQSFYSNFQNNFTKAELKD